MTEDPFFIVGCPRSGTTLLRLMLDSHPRLRVPGESWFIRGLAEKLPLRGPLTVGQVEQGIRIVLAEPWWQAWKSDEAALRAAMADTELPDLATFVDRVFRGTCGMEGKPRWGDKTPVYSVALPLLSALFPAARFVHLLRDPRDVAISMRHVGWYGGDLRRVGLCWSGLTRDAIRDGRPLGEDRYIEVAYEDLVVDPLETLPRICAFLGEEPCAAMLDFHRLRTSEVAKLRARIHTKLHRPPNPSDAGRWRRELRPMQVAVIEAHCAPVMALAGYRCASVWPLAWFGEVVAGLQRFGHWVAVWRQRGVDRLRRCFSIGGR